MINKHAILNFFFSENKSYEQVLSNYQESAVVQDPDIHTTLLIMRSRLLQTTIKGIGKPTFNINYPLRVEFAGEEAEDYGGPRREFLRYI